MKSDTNYSKAIFDDKMLQIKMGQWLGIIQSTYKKNSIFTKYNIPCPAEDLLDNNTLKRSLDEVSEIFPRYLRLFGLDKSRFYIISGYNSDEESFDCDILETGKKAKISFSFGNFVDHPSQFRIIYDGQKSKYNFITDKSTNKKILVSKKIEDKTGIKESIFYDHYSLLFDDLRLNIEFKKRLRNLNYLNEYIDNQKLKESLLLSNNFTYDEICKKLSSSLRLDLENYGSINIEFIDKNNLKDQSIKKENTKHIK